MFGGIGTGEILILLVIALIVIGPKKLPEVARTIGRGLGEIRRASYDLQRTLSLQELDDMASRLPDPTANDRLHEKTAAENLEVSATPGRKPGSSRSPYPDVPEKSGGGADTPGDGTGGTPDHLHQTTAQVGDGGATESDKAEHDPPVSSAPDNATDFEATKTAKNGKKGEDT